MASTRKTKNSASKTKRIVGKRKKNEPHFSFSWKVFALLGTIVGVMIVLLLLSNWQSGKTKVRGDIVKLQEEYQKEVNRQTYEHERQMSKLDEQSDTLQTEIDELKLKIEIARGEKKVLGQ
ncbi:MAG TPA: hypothetical protein PKH07_02075 [bacterium]|nr:hypothetical protein [bacterium]